MASYFPFTKREEGYVCQIETNDIPPRRCVGQENLHSALSEARRNVMNEMIPGAGAWEMARSEEMARGSCLTSPLKSLCLLSTGGSCQ